MDKDGKVWGETSLLFCRNNVEIHRIVGDKGGYCSKHKHNHKYNRFFVEKGSLEIRVWKDYGLVDYTVLNDGESLTVPPGIYHRFHVLKQDTIAYEIYWTEIGPQDIERESVGGKGDLEQE